jgi:NADP-dependent 3-hydroxy acid dehydrogenase YdfG
VPDDPVLLITGASTGIGAATARHAARAAPPPALPTRGEDQLRALAADLGGEGDRVLVRRCDVAEWDDQQALAAAALEGFGRIDAVFANAGFGGARGFLADDPERWRAMVLTNVYGAALTIRATLKALRETRGHLLLTGSVAGRKAMPGSLYSCTKWAVTAMGEALRQEVHGSGVRVTVIEPGAVETPFWDDPSALQDPLTADDVAETVMFALSRPPHVDVNEILVRPTAQPV